MPGRGDLIAGRYRVERKLGAGGMGVVVAALDEQMGVRVAVKLLRPEGPAPASAFRPAEDAADVEERSHRHREMSTRLIREASAAARLSSEHVTRVLDVGRLEHGDPYVVMELLDGVDLGRYAKARGPLPLAEAVTLVLQACDAIVEAHALGIVHRDLKPANLFLTRRADGSPFVKVLDFGISKVLGADDNQLTGTSDMLGSPLYMAPEQIRNARDVDGRADVWSLGAILYRLLAGRAAFEADGSAATLAAIIGDTPQPLRTRRPDVPPELEAIVARCFEKDRARRIQTVRELCATLAPFAAAHGGAPLQIPQLPPSSGAHPSLPSLAHLGSSGASSSVSASAPASGYGAPSGVPSFTPASGVAAMTSVPPNAITVTGSRGRPVAVAAVVGGAVAALVVGLVAWKLVGTGGAVAAGSGEPPAAAASPQEPTAAGPGAASSAGGAAPSTAAPSTSAAPSTAAPPASAAPSTAAPSASAAAPAATPAAAPPPSAPAKPPARVPTHAKPFDDPLGDRL